MDNHYMPMCGCGGFVLTDIRNADVLRKWMHREGEVWGYRPNGTPYWLYCVGCHQRRWPHDRRCNNGYSRPAPPYLHVFRGGSSSRILVAGDFSLTEPPPERANVLATFRADPSNARSHELNPHRSSNSDRPANTDSSESDISSDDADSSNSDDVMPTIDEICEEFGFVFENFELFPEKGDSEDPAEHDWRRVRRRITQDELVTGIRSITEACRAQRTAHAQLLAAARAEARAQALAQRRSTWRWRWVVHGRSCLRDVDHNVSQGTVRFATPLSTTREIPKDQPRRCAFANEGEPEVCSLKPCHALGSGFFKVREVSNGLSKHYTWLCEACGGVPNRKYKAAPLSRLGLSSVPEVTDLNGVVRPS